MTSIPSDPSVVINGESCALNVPITLSALLTLRDIDSKRVAIAVNGTLVPRSTFHKYLVHANDQLEILEAMQGG